MNKSFARWVLFLLMAMLMVAGFVYPCQAQTSFNDTAPSGRIFQDGSWYTPEEIGQANGQNKILKEYVRVRDGAADTFAGQVMLARWCQTRSLYERQKAHLTRAAMHAPNNRRVRIQLGQVNRNGQWVTQEQIDHQKREINAARKRYRDWREPIRRIAKQLQSRSRRLRELGADKLREITDPRSVTALELILAGVTEPVALQAVDAIHRFPHREATESMARIALLNPSARVQEHALGLLADRNRFDFLPNLIGQLVSPVSTEVSIVPTANGNVLHQLVLFQKNMDADVIRQVDSWMVQNPTNTSVSRQGQMMREAGRRAMVADAEVRQLNDFIHKKNSLLQYALRRVTDIDPGERPEDWWRWWNDENEIYTSGRPVSYTVVKPIEVTSSPRIPSGGECLVAGTPIWTDSGPRPVESLQIGDRVLCSDLDSGKLHYRCVLYPTQRPRTQTFRIQLPDETIQASGGHLFWVQGEGFIKTRDLKAGQSLQVADGTGVAIQRTESSGLFPLYNLVVDGHANYFVGLNKILSHDSTILARGEPSVEQADPASLTRRSGHTRR